MAQLEECLPSKRDPQVKPQYYQKKKKKLSFIALLNNHIKNLSLTLPTKRKDTLTPFLIIFSAHNFFNFWNRRNEYKFFILFFLTQMACRVDVMKS
jgi:hypothetical protein